MSILRGRSLMSLLCDAINRTTMCVMGTDSAFAALHMFPRIVAASGANTRELWCILLWKMNAKQPGR